MPISRSPKRGIRAPGPSVETKRPRFVVPVILIVVLAVLTVAVIAVPASLVTRLLPPFINAQDFPALCGTGPPGESP